jgi:hypothetical protein
MLAIILLIFIIENRWRHGEAWAEQEGVATASFLFFLFAAYASRAWLVWLGLRIVNDGGTLPPWLVTASSVGFIVTGVILIAAMIRGTYLFTPERWGHRYWIFAVAITAIFLLVSEYGPAFKF